MAIVKLPQLREQLRPEIDRPLNSSGTQQPAQLIIYNSTTPSVLEGTAHWLPDGSVQLDIPIATAPALGTPVQVILYGPGQPIIYEGTSGPVAPDGSFEIIIGR